MIGKLIEKIQKTGAPICVGLDPNLSFVPEGIKKRAFDELGETPEGAGKAIFEFNKGIVDATYDLIPAVKPQIAMYEQFGIPGLKAFKDTVDYCHEKGLLVIGDIKRGDIGNTSASYAKAHIGEIEIGSRKFSPFNEDFCTVNPYLGSDGVEPFINVCKESDRGIFVLVKTSNKSSGELQDRETDGKPVYEVMAEYVDKWGSSSMEDGYSNVGAVVGATYPEIGRALRKLMPHTYILVPGYGAQGGTAEDIRDYFNKDGLGAIVNSSRGIIAAYTKEPYKDRFDGETYADAAREAVKDMIEDLRDSSLRSE
ncbi:MAG: orotidine-5'-phosphate decarboxylase [Lachnospiraceae bacterium]|nr:orotidine-5'-phosphate decarboxylase [Lachnospiraceae bacterium]